MSNIERAVKSAIALAILISIVMSGYFYLDARHANAVDVEKKISVIDKKVTLIDLKIIYREALEDLYFYRKQARRYSKDKEIKKRLKVAEQRVKGLEEDMYE